MRAIRLHGFGPPEVLVAEEVAAPSAGSGQALVEVAFANITFVETQFRATGFGPFQGEFPVIPGNGVGGVVAAVGPEVDEGLIGRRVVSATGGSGGYAELAAVDADGLIEVPAGVGLDAAVALLADGRTAIMLVEAADPGPGDRVLVEAAAGGVGSLLVQLVRAAGATVAAGVGSLRKAEVARDLGADLVVVYGDDGWPAQVRDQVGALSVVFDGVGGAVGRTAFDLLGDGGRMVRFGAASGQWAQVSDEEAAGRGVRLLGLPRPTPQRSRAATAWALTEAAAGRLRPLIGQRFPLERAADAHAAIEARATVGKTLLEVRPAVR
jgi:NADPH:quinone reductase